MAATSSKSAPEKLDPALVRTALILIVGALGWLAALRGDAPTAETMLAALADLRASEDPEDKADVGIVEALPLPPAASRKMRCATPAARLLTLAPSGSAATACGGRGRWPPATCTTRPPPVSCSPCSTPASPGTLRRCYGPNATWSAPGSPPATVTRPPHLSPPRSAACAS
jgi:hypothetical protein